MKSFSQLLLTDADSGLQEGEKRLDLDEILMQIMQTKSYDDGKLKMLGNAIQKIMKQREKEKIVIERFGSKINNPHVKTKNGREITYFLGYYNGKNVTAETREGLIDKLYAKIAEESEKDITLERLFEMYYDARRSDKSISAQTSSYDLSNWNRFFFDKDGKMVDIAKAKIVDVTSVMILGFYKDLVKRGELTKKAFNKASGLMNGMFDLAIEKGIVSVNAARNTPTHNLKFRPENDNSDMVYRPEERETLIKYMKSISQTRYTLACRLMACLPLRMNELRALTWEDYNERERKLHIHHSIVKERRDGKERCDVDMPFTKGSKDSGIRKIPVSNEAAAILAELKVLNGDCHYILQGQGNAAYSLPENKINEHLRKYCEGAGVTYFSSHKFRFYGASQLYKAGVPIDTIRYYLGHSDVKMTMHYLRLTPEDADMDTINRIFG